MRKHKYRVWLKTEKKMIYNCYFNKNFVFSYTVNEGEQTVYPIKDCIIMEATNIFDATKFKDLPPLEQREWLETHTKEEWKGIEIYEGDVVSLRWSKDNTEYSVVSYSTRSAGYRKGYNDLSSYQKLTKIAGNIYEGYPEAAKSNVEYYQKVINDEN